MSGGADRFEAAALGAIVASVLLGTILARAAPSAFETYVTEDGVIEWLSVAVLLAGACVCAVRLARWRRPSGWPWFIGTAVLLALFLFGAGEEISWGQRLLGTESPGFFRDHNAQRETNFHNLVVFGVKVNKLVFSKLLGVFTVLYWFLLPVLYRRRARVQRFVARWAVPIVRLRQVAVFVVAAAAVLLTPHERRWELLEYAYAAVFVVAVVRPLNRLAPEPRQGL